ncbi:HET-domain-containing protein [Gyrodon lividus]|nr:HET-domain-containing protein [Gyrodon lividus]
MANDVSELETRITFHSIGAEREGDGRGSKDHGLNTEQIRLADDHSRVALGGSNETNQAVSAVTVIPEPDERYTPSPAIAQRRKQNASAVDGLAVFLLNEARPEEETVYSAPSTSSKEDVSYDKRSQNRSLVCNKCWQHFYTGPQILQPFISNSSITYTASLDELENSINNCSMCRFFLKSIQLRQKSTENYLEIGSPSERFLLEVSTGTKTKHPNPETAWLAVHCNELRVGTFVVFSDDPTTASYIRRRDMNFDVGSDASYQLAKTWLQECVEEHEGCPKYEQQPLPARVLDVTPIDGSLQHQIRLCVPNGEAAAYTTLSYCWGGPQPFSTQKSTLETLMKGIDMQQLPSTICDAITVTRRLGLRYLWVDAFCIIQDDDLDKQKEIARMGEIYQHSYCTIIAECAAKVSDGFLHKKPEPPDCSQYRLPYVVPDGGVGTMLLRSQEAYGYDPLEEPLNARGWTLQERLLPPRQLLYTSRSLRWKCQSREYVDGGVTFNMYDEPYLYSMTRVLDVASGKLPTPDLGNGVIDPWNPWGFWKRLIMEFSRRLCTDPADRVRAIGGIAKEFQKVWSPGSRYLAGHPECYLFESLAWRVDPFKMASRRGGYRAPSWSWMAAEGVIIYDEEPKSSQRAVEVLECNVTPTLSFTPFGDISHGVLKLHGYVREARWLSDSQGAQHIHFTHDLEFLEDSQNQHGYTVTVFPDSVEDIVGNGVVWCLITSASRTAACGLVLDVVEAGERCFRRVGYFNLASHRWAYGLGLDSSSDKHQVITIV